MSEFTAGRLTAGNITASAMVTAGEGIKFPSYTTATRPTGMGGSHAGSIVFDTDLEQLIVWNGSAWVAVGRAVDTLPVWTDNTRPTSGLVNGLIGWNEDGGVIEVYWDPGEPGDNEDETEAGWINPFGAGEGGELFPFTSFTFKSIVNAETRTGPTQSQMLAAYSGEPWADGNDNFKQGDHQGYQLWTIPKDGNYKIEAGGARGGKANNGYQDYYGATVEGTFTFTKGDKIEMVIGSRGAGYSDPHGNEAGGGGGTWVMNKMNDQLLIVAGGGGGSASASYGWNCGRSSSWSYGKASETAGSHGCWSNPGNCQGNGYGGCSWGSHQGGAGGGYLSDGYNGNSHCCNSTGGGNYSNGLVGGKGHCCYSDQNQNAGGFGGGGGGGLGGPGGAGGYTGGTVSGYWSSWSTGGGGGGSHYNQTATNVNWTQGGNSSNPAGTYTGDGWVKITAL